MDVDRSAKPDRGESGSPPSRGAPVRMTPPTAGPIVVAGFGLILAAAVNLAVAALPSHFRDTRLNLDGLGSWPAVAAGYGLGIAVAFSCYVVAWRAARQLPPTRRTLVIIIAVPIIAGLLLLPTYPLLSRDFFYTVMNARIMAHYHLNPFEFAPGFFSADPFLPYADWHQVTMPYGPFWTILIGLVGRIPGNGILANFIAFKALLLAAFLGTTALIAWLLVKVAPERLLPGLVLWAWNPLVLLETVANGHNDIVMIALIVLAFALAARDRAALALVALMMAGEVKQTALGLLPLLVLYLLRDQTTWRSRFHRLLPGVALSGALLALLYAVFWVGWWHTVFRFFGQTEFYIASPAALARLALLHWFGTPETAIRDAGLLIGGIFYLRLLRHAGDGVDALLSACYTAMLIGIVVWPVFYPWYVPWLVAVAAALAPGWAGRQAIAFSIVAGASYLFLYGLRHVQPHSPQFWSAAEAVTVFGTLLVLATWEWIHQARYGGHAGAARTSAFESEPVTGLMASAAKRVARPGR